MRTGTLVASSISGLPDERRPAGVSSQRSMARATPDAEQELFQRNRARLEKGADGLQSTDRKVKAALLYRVAKLVAQKAQVCPELPDGAARTRPLPRPGFDNLLDVLIGRLARLFNVADVPSCRVL